MMAESITDSVATAMSAMDEHALLSPSSSHRWLKCTASPRLEEQFPESTSSYAEEGTLAHLICELHAQREFHGLKTRSFNSKLKKLTEHPLFKEEMLTTAGVYVQYLKEKSLTFEAPPHVAIELKVDISEFAPDSFGHCDCVMVGGQTLHITDYKHGQGVKVSAKQNSQMMLYALGAWKQYRLLYDIRYVSMAIVQPRLPGDVEEDFIQIEDLLAWAKKIKPIAQRAFDGVDTEFVAGDHCRFCRAKDQCRARARQNMACEEFKGCVPAATAEPPFDKEVREIIGLPPLLSDEEIGDLLVRGAGLVEWYKGLESYALQAILEGRVIPGFKVVPGRSTRAFRDADAAIQRILDAGYDKAIVYDYKAKSLSELEKVVGKKRFAELMGELIYKPYGKPTLTEESDPREPYSTAAVDFAEVSANAE